jgi:phospholipid-binding lipoprotein MlaA
MVGHMVCRDSIRALLLFCLVLSVPFARGEDAGGLVPAAADDEAFFDEFDEPGDEFSSNVVHRVFDPLEPVNRVIGAFNDRLYFWALKPVAQGYEWAVPEGGRVAVRRFFANLGFPIRLASNVLQFKLTRAGVETARFGVNSTVGVLGLFDPADCWLDLPQPPAEDFGQTLGHYGMGECFALMLPILGPSNLRDTIGLTADGFLNPVAYVDPWWIYYSARTVETVNETSLRIGDYESLKKQAMDPYTFFRDAYSQYRVKQINE